MAKQANARKDKRDAYAAKKARRHQLGSAQPWLGVQILFFGSVVLITVKFNEPAHDFAHIMLVILWILTAFAAMLKEAANYGIGDRVTLFGMLLILVISIYGAINEGTQTIFLSCLSVVLATLMTVKVFRNVALRQMKAEERATGIRF